MIKVERSFPAPKSLSIESNKLNGRYDSCDVVEQLRKDFHDKCYICGIGKLQDPQIEHLLPHKNGRYPERKFDWNNLFLSCGHCNSVKNQNKYDEKIINCCIRNPEELIDFELIEDNVLVKAKKREDEEAVMTAQLIMEVFNKTNTGMREYKIEMRLRELMKEMNVFYDNLNKYNNGETSVIVKNTIKALLDRKSKFAEFKRYYVMNHKERYSGLLQYIN